MYIYTLTTCISAFKTLLKLLRQTQSIEFLVFKFVDVYMCYFQQRQYYVIIFFILLKFAILIIGKAISTIINRKIISGYVYKNLCETNL